MATFKKHTVDRHMEKHPDILQKSLEERKDMLEKYLQKCEAWMRENCVPGEENMMRKALKSCGEG